MVYVDEQITTRAKTIDHLISRLMNVLMLLRIELFFVLGYVILLRSKETFNRENNQDMYFRRTNNTNIDIKSN